MDNKQLYDKILVLTPHNASSSSFIKYIINSQINKDKLFNQIKTCSMDKLKIRFNIWRMFMGICTLTNNIQQKIEQLTKSRIYFKSLKDQAYKNVIHIPSKQVSTPKNPLMKNITSPHIQNDDNFLKDQIRKDVQRTYQQMQFFQDKSIVKLLSTILFIWCKKNHQISYQQGMNQVLASIVYVYFQQVYTPQYLPQYFQNLSQQQKNIYILFNTIQYVQADIYSVFNKVMLIQHYMYKQSDTSLKGVLNPNSKNNTPILQRIITLIDQKLKSLDIQLFRTLKLFGVQTKTFLLKWIRCMHTRQFGLQSSLLIWDSIFLDYYQNPASKQKNQFEFIDAMCVAMFVYIRNLALSRQSANQITLVYQKYPILTKGGYLQQLISLAWVMSQQLRQTSKQPLDLVLDQKNKKHSSKGQQLYPDKRKQTPKIKQKVIISHIQIKQQYKQLKKQTNNNSPQIKQKKNNFPQIITKQKKKQIDSPEIRKKQNDLQQIHIHKQIKKQYYHTQLPAKQKIKQICSNQPKQNHLHQEDKEIISEFNFSILLQPLQWQTLVKVLQQSLNNNINQQSKNSILQAIDMLRNKVFHMQDKKQ